MQNVVPDMLSVSALANQHPRRPQLSNAGQLQLALDLVVAWGARMPKHILLKSQDTRLGPLFRSRVLVTSSRS